MSVRFSVVMPAYNHERFFAAAVDSVFAQSVSDWELVFVDDGSTDATVERLEGFAADPRFRLLRQENRGAHAAIARGLAEAKGELLFLLNSDDRFAPSRRERLGATLDRDRSLAAAASWLTIVDENDATVGEKRGWSNLPPWPQPVSGPGLNDLGRADLALLQGNYVATTTNLAIRRELLPESPLADLRYCHDWDFELALARRGGIALVAEPLADYRVHPQNTLKEGADEAAGRGRMRFEILWVVARHAAPLLERAVSEGLDAEDLRARFARSAPRFGRIDLLHELLALAELGGDAALVELLDEAHPFRREAIAALAAAADS